MSWVKWGAAGILALAGAGMSHATTITMTGVVHTVCEASFTTAPVATGPRQFDLGLLQRACNDGAGYRIILHTPAGLSGAVVLLGARQIPVSESGITVLIDADTDGRATEPARIVLAAPISGAPEVRLETQAKGVIY